MSRIAYFYTGLTRHFQADKVLKDLLSQVYEQAPKNAALPYTYINLDFIEDIFTYSDLAHRVKVSCHTFCDNLGEMIKIVDEFRVSCRLYLRKKAGITLKDMRHSIICTPSSSFQSIIHIEVLSSDFGKD